MSIIKPTSYTSATAVAGTTMNALASGSFAYGSEIDNSTNLYQYGIVTIELSSAVTTTGSPYIGVYLLPNLGTGNYTTTSGDPTTYYQVATVNCVAGSHQYFTMKTKFELPAYKYKIVILNATGVAFPSTNTSVCTIYQNNLQVV